jgi:hypothetical protein
MAYIFILVKLFNSIEYVDYPVLMGQGYCQLIPNCTTDLLYINFKCFNCLVVAGSGAYRVWMDLVYVASFTIIVIYALMGIYCNHVRKEYVRVPTDDEVELGRF